MVVDSSIGWDSIETYERWFFTSIQLPLIAGREPSSYLTQMLSTTSFDIDRCSSGFCDAERKRISF